MSRLYLPVVPLLLLGVGCTDKTDPEPPPVGLEAGQGALVAKAPNNFSWVVERRLAGMARPGTGKVAAAEGVFLRDAGVRLLVSLTEILPDLSEFQSREIRSLHLPV